MTAEELRKVKTGTILGCHIYNGNNTLSTDTISVRLDHKTEDGFYFAGFPAILHPDKNGLMYWSNDSPLLGCLFKL